MYNDNIWYIQCKNDFEVFKKGEIYKVIQKDKYDWTIVVDDTLTLAIENNLIRKNFIPIST